MTGMCSWAANVWWFPPTHHHNNHPLHVPPTCCHLQYVLDNIQEEDTVFITQISGEKHLECNQTVKIQAPIRKSLILTTLKPEMMNLEEDYTNGIHMS